MYVFNMPLRGFLVQFTLVSDMTVLSDGTSMGVNCFFVCVCDMNCSFCSFFPVEIGSLCLYWLS